MPRLTDILPVLESFTHSSRAGRARWILASARALRLAATAEAARIASAAVSPDAKVARGAARIASAAVSPDAKVARGAARIAQAAVSPDVRRAEPRAQPWVVEPSQLAQTVELSEVKAPCEALAARASASAMSSDARRREPQDVHLEAASRADRSEVEYPGWTPEALSRREVAKQRVAKEVLSCLESAEEKLWCQEAPKRAAVLRPE